MPLTLSELNVTIRQTLDDHFNGRTFDLIAEIGQVTIKKDARMAYFELVEKGNKPGELIARISAQLWNREFAILDQFEKTTGQSIQPGISLLLKVSVQFHIAYGLKLNILNIDPQYTLGALAQAKEKTILRLLEKYPDKIQRVDGMITSFNQSLALPRVIQRIALVTGEQAEGGIDFIHELKKNAFGYTFQVDLFPALMQGEKSPDSIREQMIKIFQSNFPYDIVVMVRGGGATLDLHAFDQYTLIEAMIRFPIPIFTGIGHTRNVSLADEVANGAFKSPTKVAEVIIQHQRKFEEEIMNLFQSISDRINDYWNERQIELKNTLYDISIETQKTLNVHDRFLGEFLLKYRNTTQILLQSKENQIIHLSLPMKIRAHQKILQQYQNLTPALQNLQIGMARKIKQEQNHLDAVAKFIAHQSPEKWMNRGFALIRQGGKIITSVQSIHEQDSISIELKDGQMEAQLIKITNYGK